MNPHQRLTIMGSITSLLWFTASCQVFTILRTPCRGTSTAVWISGQPARSLAECIFVSRQAVASLQSVGFVQFDIRYQSCALFRYRDICQLLNLTSLAASRTQQTPVMVQQDCEGIVDTKYDVLTSNAYFAAVWVGGYGPALENLVCGQSGPRNPVLSSGVSWTTEGARMDGATSRLLVNDSTGFNFSLGYTMAIELKRQPRVQAFVDMTDCSTFSIMLDHLWEYPGLSQLYSYTNNRIASNTADQLLSADSNEFLALALTCDRTADLVKHFYGSAAVPSSAFQTASKIKNGTNDATCLTIGYRNSISSVTLNGTVRMVAIANKYLPDEVVLRFLAGN